MGSNLPPGVRDCDIPGNRPEDAEWERVHEGIDADAVAERMSDMDVSCAWRLGFAAYKQLRKLGGHLPHDESPGCKGCGKPYGACVCVLDAQDE